MGKAFNRLKASLWLAQIGFFGFLIVCIYKEPSVLINNIGISNFGKFSASLLPYSLMFLIYGLFLALAARIIRIYYPLRRYLYWNLLLLAVMQFFIWVTTFHSYDPQLPLGDLHNYFGEVAFGIAFQLSVYLVIKNRHFWPIFLLLLQTGCLIIAVLSTFRVIHLLFFAQFFTALASGLLLNSQLPKIIAESVSIEASDSHQNLSS